MPSLREPSTGATLKAPWFRTTLRVGGYALAAAVVVFCLLLLAVRFVVFPRLEANREALTETLARQIGHPVEIDTLSTGWDGWNPRLDIRGLRILERKDGAPALTLPEARLVVAWTSLWFFDLRLKELALERPRLTVRRDVDGMLHVAGLTVDPNAQGDDPRFAHWLLRQRSIIVHDAAIAWQDEQRNAQPLELDKVDFRLENHFGHYRFGLRGVPPPALAAPLDLRGDLSGTWPSVAPRDWRKLSGRLYVRLDYADVAAWREWLPLPIPIKSGKGALRLWLDVAKGEPREIVTDLVLADVQARLATDLPELSLARLEGRAGWRDDGTRREFFTRQLAFVGPGGVRFDPTDFKLALRVAPGGASSSGHIEFNQLEVEPLQRIAAYLPLPQRWRIELARFSPRGTLLQGALQWEGEATAPDTFSASGQFVDLGLAAQDRLPGGSGFSGSFDTTQTSGTLKLQSQRLTLDLPRVFAEPLAFDTASGEVSWRRDKDGVSVKTSQLAFGNAHAAGTLSGEYRTLPTGPGAIDLTAQLSRADARQAHRYLPAVVGRAVRDWLDRSLLAGSSTDTRLKLSGNLADFPFANGRKGQFLVTVKGQGITLDYAKGWPRLSDVDADVRFEGARMTIDGHRGRIFGAELTKLKADLADMRGLHPVLRIEGAAAGPTSDFLRFIAESPVADWLGHFSDGATATGNGTLALKFELPLGKPEANKIAGEYAFSANRVKLAGGVPTLNQVSGKLDFSENDVHTDSLTAEIFGGPARLTIASADHRVRVNGQGSANLGQLRIEYPQQPLAARLTGTTDWQLAINVRPEASTWTIDSSLKGAAIDLPAPAGKAAADLMPLKVERRSSEPGRDLIVVSYGQLGRLTVQRRLSGSDAIPERALLALGKAGGDADRRGLWVRGDVDKLDLDGWLALKAQEQAPDELPLSGVDLSAAVIDVFGRRLHDLHIGASRAANDWQLDLRGRELTGTARWQAPASGHSNGRISARLQRFTLPAVAEAAERPTRDAAPASTEIALANRWPEIDLVAETFRLKDHDLGKLELTAQPRGSDWRIEHLKLASDAGKLEAEGWWRGGRVQQTMLDAALDVNDAGAYLAQFGMPGAIRGAPTRINGQLAWAGEPQEFDYPTMTGSFRVEAGQGQFTKLDPGLGKLLGVLSLQSLRRRLAFDFQDLFGEGFAFDEITGDVRIQNGVMKSDNLKIVGPSARVALSGEADIARETQKLKVRVQPTLSGGLSVGAAALLLANPIIGAAVGAGSLLAQKILQDPIEQIFAYEYTVTGSWSDPIVGRVAGTPARLAAPSPDAAKP